MLRNFLKIAYRNLLKNRTYAFINTAGLALSMACGILIFILVRYHLSFDNFHPDKDRIYRLVTEQHRDNITYSASVPPPFAKVFRNNYTFAEAVANVVTIDNELITIREGSAVKAFKEIPGVSFTEPAFFDIFNFPLVEGDKNTALTEPNTALITQATAAKYFGKTDPVNQTIYFENAIPLRVTGVLRDLPNNTFLQTQVFISYPTLKVFREWFVKDDSWNGISSYLQCFVRLRPNITPEQVEKVFPDIASQYRPNSQNRHRYLLQPLSKMHFDPRYGGTVESRYLWALTLIALFIIVTACVNFINLATAQALHRSKEVGVRKVLGGLRDQLFWQFIAETALITVLAAIVAIGLSLSGLPYINSLFHTRMGLVQFADGWLLTFLPILIALVTFLAGAYPGLLLASFNPVAALKGKITNQHIGGFNIRRALIITQFTISQVLIIGMIVITGQMRYAQQSGMGFNKDAILLVPAGVDSVDAYVHVMANRFLQIPGVEKVTACWEPPAAKTNITSGFRYNNRSEVENYPVNVKYADPQYLSTFGLELVAGRNLYPSDTVREFLVNEAFVRRLNLASPSDILGKPMNLINVIDERERGPIVGVVKDFHDLSFHSDIMPVCFCTFKGNYQQFALKVDMNKLSTLLPAIEKAWNEVYPNQVYDYQFLDEHIAELYNTEETMLSLIRAFAFIAIFIGCLGLYGLVLFMAAQKTKEIGIRKVLGSSITHIIWIFGKEFSRLIVIAFLVAAPVAGWLMYDWLQDFKYHISLTPLYFISTLVFMLLISALTVCSQVLKAALANPTRSLKAE